MKKLIVLAVVALVACTLACCTSEKQKALAESVDAVATQITPPDKTWKINELKYEDDCVVCEVMVGDAHIEQLKGDTQGMFDMIYKYVKADTTSATQQALQLIEEAGADMKFILVNSTGTERLSIVIDPSQLK